MAKVCKFQVEKQQVSYDCGESWFDTGEERKIEGREPVERYSPDCGWSDYFLYRWVEDSGFTCNGYDKYSTKKQQVSYNNGESWDDVSGSTQIDTLIEKWSSDCCQFRVVTADTCDDNYRHINVSIQEASLDGETWVQTGCYSANTVSHPYSIECISGLCLEGIIVPTSAATDYSAYTNDTMNLIMYTGDYIIIKMGCYICGGITRIEGKNNCTNELIVPETCRYMESECFSGCTSLSSVTFNTKELVANDNGTPDFQFKNCTSLQNVTFPSDYHGYVYWMMFEGCESLSGVTLGNPTGIGGRAFRDCISLVSVDLGDSVKSIGESAFAGCSALTTVYVEAETPPALSVHNIFYECSSLSAIYVPSESVNAYKTATRWSDYANIIQAIP